MAAQPTLAQALQASPAVSRRHRRRDGAGGSVDYHVFEGSKHQWFAQPGPQTDKARAMVKAFIARQLKS